MASNKAQIAGKALREAFKIFDTDKSGFIQHHELGLLLTKLTDSFHVEHPSQQDISQVFKLIDVNGDGKISQIQFNSLIKDVVQIIQDQQRQINQK